MPIQRGKIFAIVGPNNIGKTTQVDLLEQRWMSPGNTLPIFRIKYPIYWHEPTGPLIYSILKAPETLLPKVYTARELQELAARNRRDYQPAVEINLQHGVSAVFEDYTLTGLVWGTLKGIPLEDLLEMNKDLIIPDLTFVMDGHRKDEGSIEAGHIHETAGDEIWNKCRETFLELAPMFPHVIINADRPVEEINDELYSRIKAELAPENPEEI